TNQKLKFKNGSLNFIAIGMELTDIKKRLKEMPTLQEFELLKERVTRLEKLLHAKQLKSA
ncbi:MAG: hypothetical protein AAB906_02770, partial [Patescibacteria group bacterium]